MGWLWASNPDSSKPHPPSQPTQTSATPASTTPSSTSNPPSNPPTSSSLSSSDPDSDFHAAFPHLAPQTPQPDDATNSTSASPYPSTLSCRAAFDSAFYCQSLGGKFNDIYRYGSLRSCSDHWSDFWFCMRIKSKPEKEKRRLVEEFYRGKEEKIRAGRNSEEVWGVRGVGEEVRGAFAEGVDGEGR